MLVYKKVYGQQTDTADEPIESEQPYIAPDGHEHILEVGGDTENIKKPQSVNTK